MILIDQTLHSPQTGNSLESLQHVVCVLILVGRLGDLISTYLVTPRMKLEANPIARRFGFRFGVLTLLICLLPYYSLYLGVMAVPPFLMVSAANIRVIWTARAKEEDASLRASVELARHSKLSHAFWCLLVSSAFYFLTGGTLVFLSEHRSLQEAFGIGICIFGLAVFIHPMIHYRRLFRLAREVKGKEAGSPEK